MIRSMTGFAREQSAGDWGSLVWELRSVNHRYLEISLRLPEEFRAQENAYREAVGARIRRGKVEAGLRYTAPAGAAGGLALDYALLDQVSELCREVSARLEQTAPVGPLEFMRWPGMVRETPPDQQALAAAAASALDAAIQSLADNRQAEGERIRGMLEQRMAGIAAAVARVRERLPEVRQLHAERLRARVAELVATPDAERIEQELVLLAQKMDVDEELDRLDSHLAAFGDALAADEPVGRRLDFLLQEFNREANTLASKSQDAEVTAAAVELKVLIEQMREQVQNVE